MTRLLFESARRLYRSLRRLLLFERGYYLRTASDRANVVVGVSVSFLKIMKNVHDDGDIYNEVGEVAKGSFEVAENSCYGVTNTRVTSAIKGGESAYNKKAMVMLFIFVIALLLCNR